MALTRRFLTGMGLTAEQVDSIIEAHTETVDGLKEQIQTYKADAEELTQTKADLKKAQEELASSKNDSYKVKYEALKEEFDQYKADQTNKETRANKEAAFKELLAQAGIQKHISKIVEVSDKEINALELAEDGTVKNAEKEIEALKTEWADFVTNNTVKGADTPNPPANTGGGKMTKEEIFKIKDPVARQNAIGENIELFTGKES